jgi:hypothetical protein
MEKVKIEREKTIQEIAGEIMTKFGNTEMGRYKIQLMCDQYSQEYLQKHNQKRINEQIDYLQGFIDQFEEEGAYQELSNDDWTVSQFLEWLKLNNYKIIKNETI